MKNIKVLLFAILSMLVLSSNAQLLAIGVSQELAQHRKANISNVIYDLTFNIPANLQEKVTGKVIITFDLKYSEDIILDFQGELNGKQAERARGKYGLGVFPNRQPHQSSS